MTATASRPIRTMTTNFILTGNIRSGAGLLAAALSTLPAITCHDDLLDPVPKIAKQRHENYFGRQPAGIKENQPEWYNRCDSNPCEYLRQFVFDRPLRKELAIGVRLPYQRLLDLDLFDFLTDCEHAGDFTVVNVLRNPIACLVSDKQAQRSQAIEMPIWLPVEDVTEFVRQHEVAYLKLRHACQDLTEIDYDELSRAWRATLGQLLPILDLQRSPLPKQPKRVRKQAAYGRRRALLPSQRLANWRELQSKAPSDVRYHLEKFLAGSSLAISA